MLPRIARWACRAVLVALLTASPAIAANESTAQRVERIVRELDDDNYRVREAAATEAEALPPDALPAIEAALKRVDLAIAARMALEKSVESLRQRSRQADRYESRLAWYESAVGGYEQFGSRSDKWDDDARKALRLAARYWTGGSRDRSLEPAMWELSRRAIDNGCDDPLMLYVYAKMFESNLDVDAGEAARLYRRAGDALAGSKYPATIRAIAALRAGEIDRALKLLPEAVNDQTVPRRLTGELAWFIVYRPTASESRMRFDEVDAILSKTYGAESPLALTIRGKFYTRYARQISTGGDSSVEIRDRDRVSVERFAQARDALLRAWKADPGDPAAAVAMLDWALDQNTTRQDMEQWYRRALEADPDSFEAANAKLLYLSPRWRDQPDEMVAFGRQLLANGNFASRLPFILVRAHDMLSYYQDEMTSGMEPDPNYYRRPEVWKDVSAVFEGYLSRYPQSLHDRSYYAKLACWAGQWDVADEQFRILGDQAKLSVFGMTDTLHRAYPLEYQKMRAEAERRASRSKKAE